MSITPLNLDFVFSSRPIKIIKLLGRGGMALVYLGKNSNGDLCAIKECADSNYVMRGSDHVKIIPLVNNRDAKKIHAHQCSQAEQEARTFSGARFKHANLVGIEGSFAENGTFYTVMQYVEGISLSEIFVSREALPSDVAMSLLRDIASAVFCLHQNGYIHRDLKPDNVIVVNYLSAPKAVLVDFGAAREYQSQTSVHTGIATDFGSPEIFSLAEAKKFGRPGRASDTFSLAGIAFWLLTGTRPPNYIARVARNASLPGDSLLKKPENINDSAWMVIERSLSLYVAKRNDDVLSFVHDLDQTVSSVSEPIHKVERPSELTGLVKMTSEEARVASEKLEPNAGSSLASVNLVAAFFASIGFVASPACFLGLDDGLIFSFLLALLHILIATMCVLQSSSISAALTPCWNFFVLFRLLRH